MKDPTEQLLEAYEERESPFVTTPLAPGGSYPLASREATWAGEKESEAPSLETGETEFLESEVWADTAEQMAFRDRVLAAHIARTQSRRGAPQRDLRNDELKTVPGTKVQTLPDTATAAGRLLAAASADLAVAQRGGDADALRTIRLGATSGYRSSTHQRDLWLGYFSDKGGYYDRSRAAREKLPAGPHSDEAVAYMLRPLKRGGFGLGGRIAAPGYSNHQGGIAIDFSQKRKRGHEIINKSYDPWRQKWHDSWFHQWLRANAATYKFKPIPTEEWHWEYRPGAASRAKRPEASSRSSTREAYEDSESPFEAASAGEDEMLEAELEAENVLEAERDPELPASELEADEALEEAPRDDSSGVFTFTSRTLPIKVAVFVPQSARRMSRVEVLVFAHGLDRCSPAKTPRPEAFITEKPFKLGEVVEASARPMILVVPFLDWEHFKQRNLAFGQNWHAFARPENLNGVVAEALEHVATFTRSRVAPTLLRLIVSGHSRAFGVLDALAKARANPEMSSGALSRLSHVWAFDTTYTSPVADWMAWLGSRDDLKTIVIYRHGTAWSARTKTEVPLSTGVHGKQFLAQGKQSNGRLSAIPVPSENVAHCSVPRKYLPMLLKSLPAVSPSISREETSMEMEDEFDVGPSEASEMGTDEVSAEFDVRDDETAEWDAETEG